MHFDAAKDIATVFGVAIALFALIKGVIEYRHQGAQKRAESFALMRQRFKDDLSFKEICDLLEMDDPRLVDIEFKDKRDFLGFFEEIALMVNSKLISPAGAHYMFGDYAIRCFDSSNFWTTVNRDSPYWSLFNEFARQMKDIEKDFSSKKRALRF